MYNWCKNNFLFWLVLSVCVNVSHLVTTILVLFLVGLSSQKRDYKSMKATIINSKLLDLLCYSFSVPEVYAWLMYNWNYRDWNSLYRRHTGQWIVNQLRLCVFRFFPIESRDVNQGLKTSLIFFPKQSVFFLFQFSLFRIQNLKIEIKI